MPEQINWAVYVQAVAGPKLATSGILELDAYDKTGVTLDVGAAPVDVQVLPGATDTVDLLVITANQYGRPVDNKLITYSTDAGATKISLDAPLVLVGAGAVGLFPGSPQTLQFENTTDETAVIEILVGRSS